MAFCSNCGKEISAQALACPQCGHPGPEAQPAPSTQGATAVTGAPVYAGWWQRVAAFILDSIIVSIPAGILMVVFSFGLAAEDFRIDERGELVADSGALAGFFGGLLLILVLGILYRVVLEGNERGQTVGKMAMKIQVRDATTGGPIGYGRALLRWFIASVLWAALYIGGIVDALFPLWDPKHQTVHDKAARSIVVQVP